MSFAVEWYIPASEEPQDILAAERILEFSVSNFHSTQFFRDVNFNVIIRT